VVRQDAFAAPAKALGTSLSPSSAECQSFMGKKFLSMKGV